MSFSTEVPGAICISTLAVPAQNGKLRVAALNHKPVYWVVGDGAADFTAKFLERGHCSSLQLQIDFLSLDSTV
jgi:hypothetical protein